MAWLVVLLLATCTLGVVRASVASQCAPSEKFCPLNGGQCYVDGVYNCFETQLCHVPDCACGVACYSPSGYGCKNGQLTPDKSFQEGSCQGGTKGDPLVQNFDGCMWYLKGLPGKVYNLLAGPDDTLNTLLVPAMLIDADHAANGTYHGTLSFRHRNTIVEASVGPEGNLTVTVDGQSQPFDSRFSAGQVTGKVVRHMTYFGQYLQVTTPSFAYAVQAVQPVHGPAGFERGHADVDITLRTGVPGLQGLIGQSIVNLGRTQDCSQGWEFPGEGTEADYVVSDLSIVPGGQAATSNVRVARKLAETWHPTFPVTVRI